MWKEEEVRETLGDIGKFDEYGLDQVLLMRVYYLFWTLDLYDIYVPTEGYTETIDKLKKDIADQVWVVHLSSSVVLTFSVCDSCRILR